MSAALLIVASLIGQAPPATITATIQNAGGTLQDLVGKSGTLTWTAPDTKWPLPTWRGVVKTDDGAKSLEVIVSYQACQGGGNVYVMVAIPGKPWFGIGPNQPNPPHPYGFVSHTDIDSPNGHYAMDVKISEP